MAFFDKLRDSMAKRDLTVKIAWLGLGNAGKTTIIKKLLTDQFDEGSRPTLAMNYEEFLSDNIKIASWDIGGQKTYRDALWNTYIAGSMGLIYVIDAADPDQFPDARKELWKYVLDRQDNRRIPILILANKQDLPTAQTAGQVARAMDLHKVTEHSYAILPTSAKTGFNIAEGLEWLRQRLTEKIKTIEL
ncbi:MAG: ADP-ribosylation factor family protein [Candidatus Odinarchaeota archaeon]